MLKPEQNELVCRSGPGTALGALMRRYWQDRKSTRLNSSH